MTDSDQKPHKRRARYSGTHPKTYSQKYKEKHPDKFPELHEHLRAKGKTPASTHVPILVEEVMGMLNPQPGEIVALSEEHGILSIPENSSLSPGDNIQIYPNHVCNVINLYEYYWLQNGNGYIERQINIDARGKSW